MVNLPPTAKKPTKKQLGNLKKKKGAEEAKAHYAGDMTENMSALVVNGGGILPPSFSYGLLRGLAKQRVPARRESTIASGKTGMVPAIDEFDLMSGDSGGCVTTWMYCWADGTKKEECKTDNLLDTGRTSDPSEIQVGDLMTLDPKKDKKGTYGYLLTGLAFCCPLNCISSNTCWLLGSCISGGLTRLLGCGMMVAPTCLWPCIPDSATFFIVIFYKYFFKFLGVAENKYMAPSEEAAKAYAKEIGGKKEDFVWPKKGAPVCMGITTLGAPSNVPMKAWTKPFSEWTATALTNSHSIGTRLPYDKGAVAMETTETDGLRIGQTTNECLKAQWAPGQTGDSKGIALVPFTYTPKLVGTYYSPAPTGYVSLSELPIAESPISDKAMVGAKTGCCKKAPPPLLVDKYDEPSYKFVGKPIFKCLGHPPSRDKLSVETAVAMSSDFLGVCGVGCTKFSGCPTNIFRRINISLNVKTAPDLAPKASGTAPKTGDEILFADGGTLDGTGVAATVAIPGVKKVVAVLTAPSFGGHNAAGPNPFGRAPTDEVTTKDPVKPEYVMYLPSLFGVLFDESDKPSATEVAGAYIPMFGHVFDNTAGGYSYLDEDGVSHQAEATVRPFDKLISLLTACQTRGDALCATITGVKVLDNPYWGTSSKEADGSMRTVDLTVLLVTLPVKWKDAINANKSLNPDGKDLFYGDTAASPYKGFPYTLKHDREGCKGYSDGGALPLFGYQKDSINLAGYLGDWIISNAWPNVKYALE